MQDDGTKHLEIPLIIIRDSHGSRRMIADHDLFVANAIPMPGMPGHTCDKKGSLRHLQSQTVNFSGDHHHGTTVAEMARKGSIPSARRGL